MSTPIRRIPIVLGAILYFGLALSACGGSTSGSSNTVARVNGEPITRQMVTHWENVSVGLKNFTSPQPAASRAVLPDPPNFTQCIASLRAAPKSTTGPLKQECQTKYTELQEGTTESLINADWVRGEAAEEGVQVSDGEVLKRFNEIKQQQFPKRADFQKFLTTTHQSTADILFSLKTQALAAKLSQKAAQGKSGKAAETALSNSVQNFTKKWKARTSCSAAYVVKDCKEFR
jgi:hypothetical protein